MEDFFDWTPGKWDWLKYLPHHTWRHITDFYYNRKYTIQRLFKGYSDMDIFELYSTTARTLLPRLIEFKKSGQGYPGTFSEYIEHEWQSREVYDKAITDGKILGGGPDAWDKILDKMIFSFTHILAEDSSPVGRFERRIVKEYKEKYGDVWEKKESNKVDNSHHYFVNENKNIKDSDTASMMCPEENFTDTTVAEEEAKGLTYKGFKKRSFYHNDKLAEELNVKCDEGLKLFGEYFRNLWN